MIGRILATPWFPFVFASGHTARHIGMLAYTYWDASGSEKNFDTLDFFRRDFARPLFETFAICGAWSHHHSVISVLLALDLPVYAVATLLHTVISGSVSCVDALLTPRGHVLTTALAFPSWLVAGLGLRRLAAKRWRRQTESKAFRHLLALSLLFTPFGGCFLILSAIALFACDIVLSVRLFGVGFWFVWAGALSAERLRVWPFHRLHKPQTAL